MFHQSLKENGITLESCKQVAFRLFVVEGVSGLGAAGSKKSLLLSTNSLIVLKLEKK